MELTKTNLQNNITTDHTNQEIPTNLEDTSANTTCKSKDGKCQGSTGGGLWQNCFREPFGLLPVSFRRFRKQSARGGGGPAKCIKDYKGKLSNTKEYEGILRNTKEYQGIQGIPRNTKEY